MHRELQYNNLLFGNTGTDKRKINKCLYMAYTGCMDSVCRVEGKAGLVLGEGQGRVQRVPDPGASISEKYCDGGGKIRAA